MIPMDQAFFLKKFSPLIFKTSLIQSHNFLIDFFRFHHLILVY
jgi:hypothetical protein